MLADKTLDCSNLNCPMPIVKTKKAIEDMSTGQILKVICTDQASKFDMPAFSKKTGHELIEVDDKVDIIIFYLKVK